MAPKSKFANGEKALCFHGPLIYEAKVLKVQVKNGQYSYFVHYSGWSKSWDEWVPEKRMLKFTEENLQKQNLLEAAYNSTPKSRKTAKTGPSEGKVDSDKKKTPLPADKSSKQKASTPASSNSSALVESSETCAAAPSQRESGGETEEEEDLELKIEIPGQLKILIADDYHSVQHEKKLVHLPARISIDDLIEEYVKDRSTIDEMTTIDLASRHETAKGVQLYFNTVCETRLLYNFERTRHQTVVSQNPQKSMTQIYGPIHLLRLFVQLGTLLSYTRLDEEGIDLLSANIHDFISFVLDHMSEYFSEDDYESATPEYIESARSKTIETV